MIIDVVAGTRPEVVKLAPVYRALAQIGGIRPRWVATGQHGLLADQALEVFGILPDARLCPDWDRASLASLTASLLNALDGRFRTNTPDYVLVQGDTASAFAGAQAAFLQRIPVGHVEAGLRSGRLDSPFPEEAFRQMIARVARDHFAPTRLGARNLRREGVGASSIRVTGNTVVDAVTEISRSAALPPAIADAARQGRLVLVTVHRRENWDEAATRICSAILRLRDAFEDVRFIVATHTNPRVLEPVMRALAGQDRVILSEPLAYDAFIAVLKEAYLVLSDSGGVQEEAPTLGAPVLVLRDSTERSEAVSAGAARLVSSNPDRIVREASRLLKSPRLRARMAVVRNPFGDGRAGERIAAYIGNSMTEATTPGPSVSTPKRPVPPLTQARPA